MPAPVPSRHPKDNAPVSALSRAQLPDVLSDLVRGLERLDLALSADGIEAARTSRDGLTGQVRDQVVSRPQDADVLSIVVVGESTGVGKSTPVNSVFGQEVSVAGVLRPAARTPVLVANPEDMDSLPEHPLTQICRQEVSATTPADLALIDASDLGSVYKTNRALADRLLEVVDLWLFVTTVAYCGDQTPWTTLEKAARRETPIGVILNWAPAKVLPEVRRDLITRLQGLGLLEAPFFAVPDARPHEGLLSDDGVSELRDWLQLLVGRHRVAGLARRTGRGVWSTLRVDLERLADDVDAQDAVARELERTCQELRETAIEASSVDIKAGSAGQGATATWWITLASSGGPLASSAQGGRPRREFLGRADKVRVKGFSQLVTDARGVLASQLRVAMIALSAEARRAWTEAEAERHARRLLRQGGDAVATIEAWVGYLEVNIENPQDIRRLSPGSAIDLLISTAAGADGAVATARYLGLEEQTAQVSALLVKAVTEALTATVPRGAATPFAPAPGFAVALCLRSGELKPFTRPGATA